MTRCDQVLKILAEGPATTSELDLETGWGARRTGAIVWHLWQKKRVTRTPWEVSGDQCKWLWAVP